MTWSNQRGQFDCPIEGTRHLIWKISFRHHFSGIVLKIEDLTFLRWKNDWKSWSVIFIKIPMTLMYELKTLYFHVT